MVSFPLRVQFKLSDEQTRPVRIGVPHVGMWLTGRHDSCGSGSWHLTFFFFGLSVFLVLHSCLWRAHLLVFMLCPVFFLIIATLLHMYFYFFFLDEPRSIAGTSSWIIQSSTGSSSLTEFHTYGNLLCVYLLFRLISIAEKDMNTWLIIAVKQLWN